jgi:hypothetical protein
VKLAWVRDPASSGLALFAAIALAGFIVIGLGWRIAARTGFVALQVPALVSGGVGGLALIVTGAALLHIQVERHLAAQEQNNANQTLDDLHNLLSRLSTDEP